MRLLLVLAVLIGLSCGQNSKKQKSEITDTTTTVIPAPDTIPVVKKDTLANITPEEMAVNASLQKISGNQWSVLNDKKASWMKDVFEYFIVPQRKKDPNFPYIATGDFNNDGKMDTAALVRDTTKRKYQVAILLGNEIKFWDEDIGQDAAIAVAPKGQWQGMNADNFDDIKTVRSKSDGIEVIYFESASFIVYLEKNKWKRLQTSD